MTSTTPAGLLLFAVLVTMTTYRLTVLVIRDTITAPFRDFVQRRFYGTLVNYFTKCPWCVSVWLGAAITAAAYWWWPWFRWPMVAASASALTGILFEKV